MVDGQDGRSTLRYFDALTGRTRTVEGDLAAHLHAEQTARALHLHGEHDAQNKPQKDRRSNAEQAVNISFTADNIV